MGGQVEVKEQVVLHVLQQLEAVAVPAVIETLEYFPELGFQFQEKLELS